MLKPKYPVIEVLSTGSLAISLSEAQPPRVVSLADLESAALQDDPELASFYAGLLEHATVAIEKARIERVARCDGHLVIRVSGPAPFSGPVSGDYNPSAHGCVSYTDFCRCGASRRRNCNGCHEETGAWW